MPFSSVADAEAKVPVIQKYSDLEKRKFVVSYNKSIEQGMEDGEAISKDMDVAKEVSKSLTEIEFEKALKQVTITTSIEEMLRKFFGMWYDDAELLCKLMGYETENEYYYRENGMDMPLDSYMEDRLEKFDLMKQAFDTGDYSQITSDIIKDLKDFISKEDTEHLAQPIIKTADPLKREVTFVYYEPDVPDAHGQYANKETIAKGCTNFNENLEKGNIRANLFHDKGEDGIHTETDSFSILKSWINPEDCEMGGQKVTEGTWLVKVKFENDYLWDLFETGEVRGVSMGARGHVIKPGE